MGMTLDPQYAIRYRGFVLLEQQNSSWLVRPERSPMKLLPFRTHACSLADVKAALDRRLKQNSSLISVA